MASITRPDAVTEPLAVPTPLLPVNVYSPAGEPLFAGRMESSGQPLISWNDAHGDHIYRMSMDWASGERFLEPFFRLIEPF